MSLLHSFSVGLFSFENNISKLEAESFQATSFNNVQFVLFSFGLLRILCLLCIYNAISIVEYVFDSFHAVKHSIQLKMNVYLFFPSM